METFSVILLRHILDIIEHGVQNNKDVHNSQTPSYGKQTGSQMDCEKAALVKMQINMAFLSQTKL